MSKLTQSDIVRAIRAAKRAGLPIRRVDLMESGDRLAILTEGADGGPLSEELDTELQLWRSRNGKD